MNLTVVLRLSQRKEIKFECNTKMFIILFMVSLMNRCKGGMGGGYLQCAQKLPFTVKLNIATFHRDI